MYNFALPMLKRPVTVLCAMALLAGCQAPGSNLKANVYKAGQVNSVQEAQVIKILAVMPAQIEADNSQQKKGAEVVGGLLGAIGGGVLGNEVSRHSSSGTAIGAVGGGVGGAAAGSLVSDTVLVEGVSITYKFKSKTFNSAQVGRLCEFVPGKAVVISTGPNETRIQPNATCPVPEK